MIFFIRYGRNLTRVMRMNNKKEIWKGIRDFPNYEVSNLGRIRNKKFDRILKPLEVGWGYVVVELWNNGQSQSKKIHRLVAEAFIPNPNNKPQVNHIDGNKKIIRLIIWSGLLLLKT